MSLLEWRGGIPAVTRGDVGTTPVKVTLAKHLERLPIAAQDGRYSPGHSKWLVIQAFTADLKVYFFEEHATADEHYITVVAGESWSGPAEARAVWVAATAGTSTYEIAAMMRRG